MKKVFFYIALCSSVALFAQTDTENNIKTTTYQKAYTINQITSALDNDKIETVGYSDGMGRPKQSIALRAGGNKENIVQYIEYDELGRQQKSYLPYASNVFGAEYIDLATAKESTEFFYNTSKYQNTQNPFSESVFEASPRSRVTEVAAPGESWKLSSDHTVKTEYNFNYLGEVRRFSVTYDSSGDPQLQLDGHYGSRELSKVISKDENWIPTDGGNNLTHTFADKSGKVVLKRHRLFDATRVIVDQSYEMDTYYIYDNYGNLVFVLSPEASDQIVDSENLATNHLTILDQLGYQYKYDNRNRLVEKKIPGRGIEYIFYDNLDRPILTQDTNLRIQNKYLFTKYDAFDRVVYTGIYNAPGPTIGRTREEIQDEILNSLIPLSLNETRTTTPTNINGTNVYYTSDAHPSIDDDLEVHTVNYYDSYVDLGGLSSLPTTTSFGTTITDRIIGLPTVSKVKVLDVSPARWITSITGYDNKGRAIYAASENPYLQKTDIVETDIDFTGKPLESISTHTDDNGINPVITIRDYFNYDHIGRLLTHEQKIDDSPVQLISGNKYDNIGQVVRKNVGGETYIDGYTAIANVNVSIVSNTTSIEKVSGGNLYNGGLRTRGSIVDNGGVEFKVKTPEKELRGGLIIGDISGPSISGSYETLDFGLLCTGTLAPGSTSEYILKYLDNNNGVYYNAPFTYSNGDILSIKRVERLENNTIVFDIQYQINGNLIATLSNVTDAKLIGKLAFKTLNGKVDTFKLFGTDINKILQRVNYKYNVRGWMTDINNVDVVHDSDPGAIKKNSKLFSLRINYDQPVLGSAQAPSLYNGNISQTIWRTANDDLKRGYAYEYDHIDRLVGATMRNGNLLSNTDVHNVSNVSYDKNGNLLKLNRTGMPEAPNSGSADVWDALDYVYVNGNQLHSVTDKTISPLKDLGFRDVYNGAIEDYTYDLNGNMKTDVNKNITNIDYNHLDLPTVVTINNAGSSGSLTYVYDATGVKMSKHLDIVNRPDVTTQYAGGFVYENNTLQFISQPEGYIIPATETSGGRVKGFNGNTVIYSEYDYVFQYTDHLGNVRLSYSDANKDGSISTSEIIEETNYYPFGLKHLGYNYIVDGGNDLAQAFKYNGVEYNQDLDLNLYEMDLRMYDPAIGRFNGLDPVIHYSQGTSVAFDNNPVFWADPSGADSHGGIMPAAASGHFGHSETGSGVGRIDVTGVDGGITHLSLGASNKSVSKALSKGGTNPYQQFFKTAGKQVANGDYSVTPFQGGSGDGINQISSTVNSLLGTGWLSATVKGGMNLFLESNPVLSQANMVASIFKGSEVELLPTFDGVSGERSIMFGIVIVGAVVDPSPGGELALGNRTIKSGTTLYRAVSKAELDDITKFGFRTKAGGYETGKLFTTTAEEAAQFGRNNFKFDGLSNTIIKVNVPRSVMNRAHSFKADGMNAISIPSSLLNRLGGSALDYSPFFK